MGQKAKNLGYDPRLKACVRELRNVLEKYAVAGAISIASDTHGELAVYFPKWSLVGLDETNQLRVRMRAKEKERSDASLHLLLSLTDSLAAHSRSMADVTIKVLEAMEAEGVEVDHEPLADFQPDTWPASGDIS